MIARCTASAGRLGSGFLAMSSPHAMDNAPAKPDLIQQPMNRAGIRAKLPVIPKTADSQKLGDGLSAPQRIIRDIVSHN